MMRKSPTPLALPEIVRIVGADAAYLYFYSESTERLHLKSARDAEGKEADLALASGAVLERVRLSREPFATSGDPAGAEQLDGSPLPARHMLAAPLLLGHRFFGVIYLVRPLTRGPFTQDDVDILLAIADHLALALETAHTERLELERNTLERRAQRLARSNEEALDASRAKSAFIAHMSHELRTPLTAIIGYSELLEDEFNDVVQAGSFIPDMQKIQAASKHLLSLINNMLDLSKIEAGKMELFLEDFDLAEVIDEVSMTARPLIEKNRNTFVSRCEEALGPVRLDRVKVRQVLLNLLSNAAKFTSSGEVALAAHRRATDHGEQLVFTVSDSGIGMSPSQIKRIFQEFAQGSAATTRRYGGTGLGLAISRNFCQLMRGDVEVESALGRGTTFTVRLPVRLAEADLEPPGEVEAAATSMEGEEEPMEEGSTRSGVYPWTV
ncbi:sensor histidine kinase [Nannocystis bainbridge]|uniref:histidine kinase n=1 Tax=Nannocystis bainbridge TaxID=2995303 RepID=A0ABT5DXV9_9BACT|nr:HAMP domain-containing sensor histidine kinase [Nannocystis bainbridge]MDC0718450.1 HAMP domain-containing sensor histidine kinase [Nannocystis bainbridge]